MWLQDVINMTKQPIQLKKNSSVRSLECIATRVNETIDYPQKKEFVMGLHIGGDHIRVHVYDDFHWGVVIEVKQWGRPDVKETWKIQNQCVKESVTILFQEGIIWFYPIKENTLKLHGEASCGWFLKLNARMRKWEAYNVQT